MATEEQLKALKEHGKDTRFGGPRANPHWTETSAPHAESVRKSARYIGKNPSALVNKGGKYIIVLPKEPSPSQVIAASALQEAMDKDSPHYARMVEWATDQIDGKLHQVNVNTDLDKFEGMSEEELHDYNLKLEDRITAASRSGTSEDGAQQSAGGHDAGGGDSRTGDGSASAREDSGEKEVAARAVREHPVKDV